MQTNRKTAGSACCKFGLNKMLASALAACLALAASAAFAQGGGGDAGIIEEVVVTGTRSTIQTSIETKRLSDNIVEALSAEDIGDIPALSIGEALETLTSAASHREQGGATEISIRGLGPFLGSTTLNGREATNGSGDRSVNFSQFPSELFSKLNIYKTQQASLVEGGVSGQIALQTIKPLEYGKRRMQGDFKANYNPDNANININERDLGYRATASYIDQFASSEFGELGISLGFQKNVATNPEQEHRSSSAYRDCRNDPSVSAGVYSSSNCDSGRGDLVMEVDPATGTAPDANAPFIFVPSQRSFRQNITDDDRDAIFAALQWRPNERADINLDFQYSDRIFTEVRNDLVFAEQRRVHPEGLVASPTGTVSAFKNEGRIETLSTYQERLEEYVGGGFNLAFQVNERLRMSFDASYSDTSRRENIIHTRLQSEPRDIFGERTPAGTDRPDTSYMLPGEGSEIPLMTVTNFDVTNADLFADNARTRIDLNQARENSITAFRGDFELQTDWGLATSIEGGIRYSQLGFKSWPRVRDQRTFPDSAIAAASMACRNGEFPESGFLSEPSNGQDLVTNVDEDGNVIPQGTGSSYATFDPLCLVREFVGELPPIPSPRDTVGNVDVDETTIAGYLQANYRGEFGGRPVRGNLGLRIVNTDVDSTGLRTTFTTEANPDGTISVNEDGANFQAVVGGKSYTQLLPSFNAVVDLQEDLLLRAGIFRGLSRPDPADLGFGRSLSVNDDDDPTSIADLAGSANASGNPDLKPLTSWNFDLALEWYPNPDSILAGGVYYKRFLGGFENTQRVEQFEIDGQPFSADVTTSRTISDPSRLFGFEMTFAHAFTYLPGALSGLGTKVSYNYADSNFEFEDQNFGASRVLNEAGEVVSERVGLVVPAGIFGLSKHVLSAQAYYQIAGFDLQVIYKHRSRYFQQFISSPGLIRYIGDTGVVEARLSYRLNDRVSFRLEGINLFDEPRKQYIPTPDNLSELNSYGPRLFLGVRVKL